MAQSLAFEKAFNIFGVNYSRFEGAEPYSEISWHFLKSIQDFIKMLTQCSIYSGKYKFLKSGFDQIFALCHNSLNIPWPYRPSSKWNYAIGDWSDEFIQNSSQKIQIYQNIALCKSEEDVQNVTDEIIDIYGQIPYEIENLLDISRIKILAKEKYIIKISQKAENIIFYFESEKFNFEVVDKLMKIYRNRIKFSPSKNPYITFKLANYKNILGECKEFLGKL